MAYTEEFLTPDEIVDEHSSDKIFPDLPDDVRPSKVEWVESGCMIEMACGCMVEVHTGDILWVIPSEEGSRHLTPIAIDPATIH